MNFKGRVVVGMSGGVDSSVAAALLLREGWEVLGVTLRLWAADEAAVMEDRCCGPEARSDARRVAGRLGIPHRVLDEMEAFEEDVVQGFIAGYQTGRTPNPCVLCNEKLKFGRLLRTAEAMGATHVATGHYARVEHVEGGYELRRARDLRKDQSYFLFSLRQEQLARMLMPLGGLTKQEVRELARELDLGIHDKEESQDICFIEADDYAEFLRRRLGAGGLHPGEIVDEQGRTLGRHEGIELFTVGQRKGINVGSPVPLYVAAIDAVRARVVVGRDATLWHNALTADGCRWGASGPPAEGMEAMVKIRSGHEGAAAHLFPKSEEGVVVRFTEPQRAITPGQATVFYEGDRVLGGGWIRAAEDVLVGDR